MSTSARVAVTCSPAPAARPAPRPRPAKPQIAVVTAPVPRVSTGTFVLLVSAVLALGLIGLLILNTMLGQGAFEQQSLSKQQAKLTVQEQALQQEVAVLQSPQELARRAAELGMVPNLNPVFLDLRTNKILGVVQPGQRPPVLAKPIKPALTPPVVTKPVVTKPVVTKRGAVKR